MMEDLQRECDLVGVLTDAPITIKVTHDPGLTHGASAHRRGGDELNLTNAS